jgi:hypothetical protein
MPFLVILLLFAAVNILYTEEPYTTSISLKKISNEGVRISFDANTNHWKFRIYRSDSIPVSGPDTLDKVLLSGVVTDGSVQVGDLFRFSVFTDKPAVSGSYFYAVLPEKSNYTRQDFLAGMNYTMKAFVWEVPVIQTNTIPTNTNLSVADSNTNAATLPATNQVTTPVPTVAVVTNAPVSLPVTVMTNATKNEEYPVVRELMSVTNVVVVTVTNFAGQITQDVYYPRISDLQAWPDGNNKVRLSWRTPKPEGFFSVYRATNGPISGAGQLTAAEIRAGLRMKGKPDEGSYRYNDFVDYLEKEGKYYYYVAIEGGLPGDFRAGGSYHAQPVLLKRETVEVPVLPEIKGIFARKEQKCVRLFWQVGESADADPFRFLVYRTSNAVTNLAQVMDTSPWKEVEDDFTCEDTDIEWGMPYFYTVLLDGRAEILPGTNTLTEPVIFGSPHLLPIVVSEVVKTNISAEEFYSKFRK